MQFGEYDATNNGAHCSDTSSDTAHTLNDTLNGTHCYDQATSGADDQCSLPKGYWRYVSLPASCWHCRLMSTHHSETCVQRRALACGWHAHTWLEAAGTCRSSAGARCICCCWQWRTGALHALRQAHFAGRAAAHHPDQPRTRLRQDRAGKAAVGCAADQSLVHGVPCAGNLVSAGPATALDNGRAGEAAGRDTALRRQAGDADPGSRAGALPREPVQRAHAQPCGCRFSRAGSCLLLVPDSCLCI